MLKSNNQSNPLSNIKFVQDIAHETAANYSGGVGTLNGSDPDVILYTDSGLQGGSLNVNAAIDDGIPNIGFADGQGFLPIDFNDKVSSVKIIRGNWQFFVDDQFNSPVFDPVPPGTYNFTEFNDQITSLKRVG